MHGWLQGRLTGTLLGMRSIPSLPLSVQCKAGLAGSFWACVRKFRCMAGCRGG